MKADFKWCLKLGSLLLVTGLFPNVLIAKETEKILIDWGSAEGIERFSRSEAKVDFFPLANHFESQNNKIYCGVASSTIVLNALRVRNKSRSKFLPEADAVLNKDALKYMPIVFSPFFDRYTQNNVFTDEAKSRHEVLGKPIETDGKSKRDVGLQLEQLKALLESHKLKVDKHVVPDNYSLEKLRADFKRNLTTKDDFILVNYHRKSLNQKGGGHISPVGAYDSLSDSVLVMDVNSNKANWVWVSLENLAKSMATHDTNENRGYLLISEK